MAETLTAQQRAQLFAMSTRQNLQMLAKQTATDGATTLTFQLPKARLLSKIMVRVKAQIKITHATATTVTKDVFTPFKLMRRVSIDLNNGFSPYVLSGEELAMYNMVHINEGTIWGSTSDSQSYVYMPALTASSTGATNNFAFTMELPVTLNDRDPIGLILLQNDQTNVNLICDIANGSEIIDNASGYTVAIDSVEITPMLETFSVPANQNAYPDLTVIKLINGRNDSLPSAGQQIVKLSTGTIYRRILFKIEDSTGAAISDSDITSNIDLVFNQADVNYSISAPMLRALNERMYGHTLPKGMFVFDFAWQGITGLSGTRDYIDTEKLTEFWLRFNTSGTGRVKLVTECLARLQ